MRAEDRKRALPGNPAQLFVVIGAQRTGTNLLREILNTNQQIAMLGEVLTPSPAPAHWENFCRTLPGGSRPPANYGKAEALLDQYFEFVEYRIRNHWEGNRKNKIDAFGVDIKYDQLAGILFADRFLIRGSTPLLLCYLRSRQAILIHTTRNIIHCAISALIAAQRNLWHNYEGVEIGRRYEIDVEGCLSYARAILRRRQLFHQAAGGCKVVNCRYETLVHDIRRSGSGQEIPEASGPLRDIAAALGVVFSFRHDGRLQKAINVPYNRLISNYDAFIERLHDSEFASLIPTLE